MSKIRPSPSPLYPPSICARATHVDTNMTAKFRFLLQQKFCNVAPIRVAPLFRPGRWFCPSEGAEALPAVKDWCWTVADGRCCCGQWCRRRRRRWGHSDLSRSFHCGQRFRFISLSAQRVHGAGRSVDGTARKLTSNDGSAGAAPSAWPYDRRTVGR